MNKFFVKLFSIIFLISLSSLVKCGYDNSLSTSNNASEDNSSTSLDNTAVSNDNLTLSNLKNRSISFVRDHKKSALSLAALGGAMMLYQNRDSIKNLSKKTFNKGKEHITLDNTALLISIAGGALLLSNYSSRSEQGKLYSNKKYDYALGGILLSAYPVVSGVKSYLSYSKDNKQVNKLILENSQDLQEEENNQDSTEAMIFENNN
jgi:hypothetical protein